MLRAILFVCAGGLMLPGAELAEPVGPRPVARGRKGRVVEAFKRVLATEKAIVFLDSSKKGARSDRAILDLRFLPDSRLLAHTWGNGFSHYQGTFALTGRNRVEIHLENQVWPVLVLAKRKGRFVLRRKDGLRSLTKHVVSVQKDGTRELINDGDIYPEAEGRIFPLRQERRE